MSGELLCIGIGAGDPDWITVEAIAAIRRIDVLFVVVKSDGPDELVEARRALIERYREQPVRTVELPDPPRPWRTAADYAAAVRRWRAERSDQWGEAISRELGETRTGGFLVWGDPSLFESTLAILQSLETAVAAPRPVLVIPGVSCVHALTARHGVSLNRPGRAVQIMPARLLGERLPPGVDDVVVMLDANLAFATLAAEGIDIYWGAYLGTPDEILVAGSLADVRDEIVALRAEAIGRKGWVFDTYLLRRR